MTPNPLLACCLLMAASCSAQAVNKCTGADGKVTYQDTPCVVSTKSEAIKITSDAPRALEAKQLPFKPISISAAEANGAAKEDVELARRRMKDPDSAKFSDIRVFRFDALGGTYTMTCGELNARNSFGGYVGSKPFWVYQSIFTETYNHFLPNSKFRWLMGAAQTACIKEGTPASSHSN